MLKGDRQCSLFNFFMEFEKFRDWNRVAKRELMQQQQYGVLFMRYLKQPT